MIALPARLGAVLMSLLFIVSACSPPDPGEEVPRETALPTSDTAATYTSAQYGFSLSFPKDTFAVAERASGEELPPEAQSYIPACLSEAAACVYYAGDAFENTNFGGAGVSVSLTGDTAACGKRARRKYPVDSARTVTISGVPFTTLQTGEAGMSHRAKETWYWTVHDGRCLTLVARISYSVYEVYEPGSIEKFSEADRARLREQLKRIVRNFSLK